MTRARKPKVPNQPAIMGADNRSYMNPAYWGFPDKQGNSARILERMIAIKVRADMFRKEIADKSAKIKQLQQNKHQANIEAYVNDVEFPDISEVDALKSDIEELQERADAARQATEMLAGELSRAQQENREGSIEVLKEREQALLDRYARVQAEHVHVLEDWRAHTQMVENITGERQSLDFATPQRPILLADPDDVVIGTWNAGSIT